MTAPIQIWPFHEAPEEYRFYDNGGDEDWVAVVDREFWDRCGGYINFMQERGQFGCCCVYEYELDDGRIVLIGCHS